MAAKRGKASAQRGAKASKKARAKSVPPNLAKPEKSAKLAKPAKPKISTKTKATQAAKAKGTPAPRQGLREGDAVPAFSLVDQTGKVVTSGSLAGKPFVLYFYPKNDTPGCTREACAFRDDHEKFRAAGITVVGVSPDDTKSHARFTEKYGLNFTLLSDAEKKLANAFGVWVKKQNYGREYMGIERSTFLIDGSGRIRKAWRGVKVDGHVAAVLGATSS